MFALDTVYYQQNGGPDSYEAWAYSDGDTHWLMRGKSRDQIERTYTHRKGYKLVFVPALPK
jgi:hypothetical protein